MIRFKLKKEKAEKGGFANVAREADVFGRERQIVPASKSLDSLIQFRPYQKAAFENRSNGIELWLWGRQTGKSFTLAAWCVDRLITMPGRTVTLLSNSKKNGEEFNRKCATICGLLRVAFEQVDLSTDHRFENLRSETRITIEGKTGRILVLASDPRTARGFSGDLALDEFAFQENNGAIWEEVKPTLEANPDYLCRICSTPNGKHEQFYRMVTDPLYQVRKVTRSDAYRDGCLIYHPMTRQPITPAEARELARNKRAYDQNYECAFEDQNLALLPYELISRAERPNVGIICEQNWSNEALDLLQRPTGEDGEGTGGGRNRGGDASERKSLAAWLAGASDNAAMYRRILMQVCNGSADRMEILEQTGTPISLTEVYSPYYAYNGLRPKSRSTTTARRLYAGIDVGRHNDRTVITVLERDANLYFVRAILRLENMRMPEQQERIGQVLRLPELRHAKMDITGIGLGLFEYTHHVFGPKISGVNFASSVSLSGPSPHKGDGQGQAVAHPSHSTVRVTEYLATQLLALYESGAIQHPIDAMLRDDLRKPERYISPTGRVSIAATRNEAGHADHFWSLALAVNAAQTAECKPLEWTAIESKYRQRRTFI